VGGKREANGYIEQETSAGVERFFASLGVTRKNRPRPLTILRNGRGTGVSFTVENNG